MPTKNHSGFGNLFLGVMAMGWLPLKALNA